MREYSSPRLLVNSVTNLFSSIFHRGKHPPMGSPASWSSRMRKKWGTTAQSPVLVSNSSPLHSRKDLTKGIKRLLKFGKKTRAADSLMDWVSVTTSEGDDDSAYRSSDELRKSRMASSQSQLSEDEQGITSLSSYSSFLLSYMVS
ncbi:unnamed protein product [Microthlaspi erraticum]|uniref:Uncharacterized protein n=1 Tax=Microthlaspi erraticum TaxID=1685480 RepID=A0A6D2KW45_9BRAS|nr:unnamed protein product [Microthlaspi erraticum]